MMLKQCDAEAMGAVLVDPGSEATAKEAVQNERAAVISSKNSHEMCFYARIRRVARLLFAIRNSPFALI